MAVPDFQTLMLPLLRSAADGRERSLEETRDHLAREFALTEDDRSQLLPSGRQAVFANRVAWSKVYLTQAGALAATRRGHFKITPRGAQILAASPKRIDIKFLDQFPEFKEFRYQRKRSTDATETLANDEQSENETPEEILDSAYSKLRASLAAELLARVKSSTPLFFEKLVVELLLSMGYGGSRKEAGEAIGRSGDEGIDGTISEDRLGLDIVYLQAKKWEGTVGRPELQKFVGALHGKRARKGVFLTTGGFSSDARDYVAHIEPKVVLVDGRQLAEFMIDFGVGVTPAAVYEIKKIDSDYFSDE